MLEKYVYNKIINDTELANLLDDGTGSYHVYPSVVPEKIDITDAIAFSVVNATDEFPDVTSKQVQFNIFSETHTNTVEISQALYRVFNENITEVDSGVEMLFSIRQDETDLGFDYEVDLYQRATTYKFKIK